MKAAETEKELSGQPDPILRFSSRKLRTNVVAGLLTLPALAPSQINGDSVACVAKVFFAIGFPHSVFLLFYDQRSRKRDQTGIFVLLFAICAIKRDIIRLISLLLI